MPRLVAYACQQPSVEHLVGDRWGASPAVSAHVWIKNRCRWSQRHRLSLLHQLVTVDAARHEARIRRRRALCVTRPGGLSKILDGLQKRGGLLVVFGIGMRLPGGDLGIGEASESARVELDAGEVTQHKWLEHPLGIRTFSCITALRDGDCARGEAGAIAVMATAKTITGNRRMLPSVFTPVQPCKIATWPGFRDSTARLVVLKQQAHRRLQFGHDKTHSTASNVSFSPSKSIVNAEGPVGDRVWAKTATSRARREHTSQPVRVNQEGSKGYAVRRSHLCARSRK